MQDFVLVTGIILKIEPISEYDKRIVILTSERGKIAAFVKGARKPTSRFLAACNPFVYAEFKMFEGRSSYNIVDVTVKNYFEELRLDFEAAYYGMYFLELMDYYTRENNDEKEFLKLLYQSFRALISKQFENQFVRTIFEIKALVIYGEYPGSDGLGKILESTKYTLEYIAYTSIEKLYTFSLSTEVFLELKLIAKKFQKTYLDRKFKSLEIIDQL
jgi:DNA repair protein RecO (recombination protein O)